MIGSGLHDIILRRNDKDESDSALDRMLCWGRSKKNQLPSLSIKARAHMQARAHTQQHTAVVSNIFLISNILMSQTPGVHDMDRRILETLIWESNPGEHSDLTVFYVCVSLII